MNATYIVTGRTTTNNIEYRAESDTFPYYIWIRRTYLKKLPSKNNFIKLGRDYYPEKITITVTA